jgi:modulator of FtsH protease
MLGFGLGPILSMYASLPNGGNIIMLSLGGTGVIFYGIVSICAGYTKRLQFYGWLLDGGFSCWCYWQQLANIFLADTGHVIDAISAVVIMIMSGFISV